MSFTVATEFPIAYESFDHIYPCGTMYDNNTSLGFIIEVERSLPKPTYLLDLGCSGGQLVADMLARGHQAVGIEGSDFSVVHERANWPTLHNVNLFTADIAKPFSVLEDGEQALFDIVTAWEVLEHIEEQDLPALFGNVLNHLKPGGWFLASIGMSQAPWMGVDLHRTNREPDWWKAKLTETFDLHAYPFWHSPREDVRGLSLFVKCMRKQ